MGVNENVGSWYEQEGAREESLLGQAGGPYTEPATRSRLPRTERSATEVEPHERTLIGAGSRDLGHVVLESEAPAGQRTKAAPAPKA